MEMADAFFMHTGVQMNYASRLADTQCMGREKSFPARFSERK